MKNKTAQTKKVKLSELLEVLSFYAEKDNYISDEIGDPLLSKVRVDEGYMARKILKKLTLEYIEYLNKNNE